MVSFSPFNMIKTLSRSQFEEACIEHTDHIYIGDKTVLCRILTRYKMYVDVNDQNIAPHLLMDGYWESWISLLFAKIIQPGMICLDIGANFGYYSLLMSGLAEDTGRTIAIEPNPHLVKFLSATQAVNGASFELVETALSDRRGEAILSVNRHDYGGGTIKPNESAEGRTQVKVPTISVDELLEEKAVPKVDVIKMDVEGVEPLIFAGMQRTIRSNPQLQIIMEYTASNYDDATGFTEYLFNEFEVQHVRGVDDLVNLDPSSTSELVNLKGHIDLYLRPKTIQK